MFTTKAHILLGGNMWRNTILRRKMNFETQNEERERKKQMRKPNILQVCAKPNNPTTVRKPNYILLYQKKQNWTFRTYSAYDILYVITTTNTINNHICTCVSAQICAPKGQTETSQIAFAIPRCGYYTLTKHIMHTKMNNST